MGTYRPREADVVVTLQVKIPASLYSELEALFPFETYDTVEALDLERQYQAAVREIPATKSQILALTGGSTDAYMMQEVRADARRKADLLRAQWLAVRAMNKPSVSALARKMLQEGVKARRQGGQEG